MEFIGQISKIGEMESLTSKNGTPFYRRELTLATVEQYPQQATFTLKGELAQDCDLQPGQTVKVFFNFRGTTTEDGRTFNHLDAWRVDK